MVSNVFGINCGDATLYYFRAGVAVESVLRELDCRPMLLSYIGTKDKKELLIALPENDTVFPPALMPDVARVLRAGFVRLEGLGMRGECDVMDRVAAVLCRERFDFYCMSSCEEGLLFFLQPRLRDALLHSLASEFRLPC